MSRNPTPNIDPVWQTVYAEGRQLNRYPWDVIVSFLMRNRPPGSVSARVLEVGCGSGANLWFAAREGFDVVGIDGVFEAVTFGQSRLRDDGLPGCFVNGDFVTLPFKNQAFDFVLDRGAISCCSKTAARKAIDQVFRVLRKGGCFFFNPFSTLHSSNISLHGNRSDADSDQINEGSLTGVGAIAFYERSEIEMLLSAWRIDQLDLAVTTAEIGPGGVRAEWRVSASKES